MDNTPMVKLYKDGNAWCALAGENIQDGVCGFGESPLAALCDFMACFDTQTLTLKEICDKGAKHPAPPAIPEDVRETLDEAIGVLERVDMENGNHEEDRGENGYEVARRWLATCPTATGEPWKTWGQDDLTAACRNVGVDLTCGKCAERFFTGASLSGSHDSHCSTATDKAVCPECGQGTILIRFTPGTRDVICSRCHHRFDVEIVVSVISPPRTEAKTP